MGQIRKMGRQSQNAEGCELVCVCVRMCVRACCEYLYMYPSAFGPTHWPQRVSFVSCHSFFRCPIATHHFLWQRFKTCHPNRHPSRSMFASTSLKRSSGAMLQALLRLTLIVCLPVSASDRGNVQKQTNFEDGSTEQRAQ